ncbi:hypothetical protein Tco_0877647 [Tanacetum coccineum]|uniref:Uncharacterized protein n=1 Tax=Tanacetum coccineum TaxID=301880 RepID=A0ABQ5BW02_9ASTR
MLNRHKNWLVHKQTACGKDFSNPFMVDNLPKIVGFSTHLASLVKSWLVQDQTVLALASPKANGIWLQRSIQQGTHSFRVYDSLLDDDVSVSMICCLSFACDSSYVMVTELFGLRCRGILGSFCLLVACLAFELNGWLQVGMASGMMSVKVHKWCLVCYVWLAAALAKTSMLSLLTKAFDGPRFNHLVVNIGMLNP